MTYWGAAPVEEPRAKFDDDSPAAVVTRARGRRVP